MGETIQRRMQTYASNHEYKINKIHFPLIYNTAFQILQLLSLAFKSTRRSTRSACWDLLSAMLDCKLGFVNFKRLGCNGLYQSKYVNVLTCEIIQWWFFIMDPRYSGQDVVRCSLCKSALAPMYCSVCHTHLCKDCVEENFSDKYKVHNVVPLQQFLYTPKCQDHPSKQWELH